MNKVVKLPVHLNIESAELLKNLLIEARAKSLPFRFSFSAEGDIDLAGVQLLLAFQRNGHSAEVSEVAWPDHVLHALKLAGGIEVMKISRNKRIPST